jgi:hypothetical protein
MNVKQRLQKLIAGIMKQEVIPITSDTERYKIYINPNQKLLIKLFTDEIKATPTNRYNNSVSLRILAFKTDFVVSTARDSEHSGMYRILRNEAHPLAEESRAHRWNIKYYPDGNKEYKTPTYKLGNYDVIIVDTDRPVKRDKWPEALQQVIK